MLDAIVLCCPVLAAAAISTTHCPSGAWDARPHAGCCPVFVLLTGRIAAAEADAIIKDKFAPALDASILRLQNMMEGELYDLKEHEGKRDAKAGKQVGYACSLGIFDVM
jgi:hypothetical protein